MTTQEAQKTVQNARFHLVRARQDRGEFSGDLAYKQAWKILFAAENLLSDPRNKYYRHILEYRAAFAS